MVALTIWQPWVELILRGDKCVENRGWRTGYRGPLALHAGQKSDPEGWRCFWERYDRQATGAHVCDYGAIVGLAELVGMDQEQRTEWDAPGQWHWRLERVRRLAAPVVCAGKQGLWQVPREVGAAVRDGILGTGKDNRDNRDSKDGGSEETEEEGRAPLDAAEQLLLTGMAGRGWLDRG